MRKNIILLFLLSSNLLSSCGNSYEVVFKNYDGTILYKTTVKSGQDAEYKGKIPEKPAEGDKFYTFDCWSESIDKVSGNMTVVAQYSEGNRYLVSFRNYDGSTILSIMVNEGDIPVYTGKNPTKPNTSTNAYVFDAWYPALTETHNDTVYTAAFKETELTNYITINNQDNEEVHILNDMSRGYFETVNDPNTQNDEIADYLLNNHTMNNCKDKGITIEWADAGTVTKPYILRLSKDSSFKTIDYEFKGINNNSYELYNLIPDKYYYQISDSSSNPVYSEIKSFTMLDRCRTIFTDDEVVNMRDLGGYKTNNGQSLKYGMVFRSSQLDGAWEYTENLFKNFLKIKTELDLRFDKDGSTYSASKHPIKGVNFIRYGLTDAYPLMLTDANTLKDFKNIFSLLANKNCLPLDYHCSLGADRTGLLSFMIEAACGVRDDEIFRDYEMTTYYRCYRPRCDITQSGDVYGYRSDGYHSGNWGNGSIAKVAIDLKNTYGNSDSTIAEVVEDFLLDKCGITQATINQVRTNLVQD